MEFYAYALDHQIILIILPEPTKIHPGYTCLDNKLPKVFLDWVYWPNLHEDAHTFVRDYFHCQLVQPVPYGTLYQVMIAPK